MRAGGIFSVGSEFTQTALHCIFVVVVHIRPQNSEFSAESSFLNVFVVATADSRVLQSEHCDVTGLMGQQPAEVLYHVIIESVRQEA